MTHTPFPFGRWTLALLTLALLTGCHSKPKPLTLTQQITKAHGLESWQSQDALEGDLHIEVERQQPLDLHFLYEIRTGRTRMRLADNTILLFDGKDVWISPASATTEKARYTLRAWPWLIVAPLRLADPGMTFTDEQMRQLGARQCASAMLGFGPGMRDYPNEWAVFYQDGEDKRLAGITFLPTDGRPFQEANDNPHAITCYAYKMVDGVTLATEWKFWRWNKTVGITGSPIGAARVYNLEFVAPKKNAFAKPADARLEEPGKR